MGWLTDLLKEYPAVAVVKERLISKEEEMTRLAEENMALKAENARLKEKLAKLEVPEDYQEREGVLYKRDASNEFTDGPRCPRCKMRMARIGGKLNCSMCGYLL